MCSKGFAKVNGTCLYYEMTGKGEVIVLIHSGFTDLRLWDDQFDFFGKYFKVIRYDIRGFGKSQRPSEPFSHCEDLKGLFNYLGIDKAHLIGVSVGGAIAIDFTLQYPQLVKSLILSGPSLNGYNFTRDEVSRQISSAGISIAKRDENFNESVEFMLNNPVWRQSNPKAREHLKNMFINTSLEWELRDLEKIESPPASERLSEITKRTLLIIGSEDSKPIKEISIVLVTGISSAEKVEIKGTGHLSNLDKPDEFNKIVLEFLMRNNGGA
ncbi:MAG: alpha/beta hydrolase [Clostridiaceae bacterium]|jgi:pimeloyl-ACP methyl ester carboxylesterase|nr:alpha/beta hydrolase [Clostridiaceae bacterium]